MAWIYLAALEDCQSHSQNGLEQSPIVKETDTLNLCCCRECYLMTSTELLSGTTLHRLEGPCYQQSISSMEDFPARTLALQEMELGWVVSEVDFFTTSKGLSEKQTRDLYFSKTSRQLELVASTVSRSHLPRSGMIVGGRLFQPQRLAPVTLEKDGSYLPTPCAKNGGYNKGGGSGRVGKIRPSLETMARANLWPTPTVHGNYNRVGASKHSGMGLATAVGGALSPMWTEWLMGYSIGWTELNASVTQWYRSKRKQRL